MHNINDNIKKTILYIKTILDTKIEFELLPQNIQERIPASITGDYKFYCSFIIGLRRLLYFSVDNITPAQLQKQIPFLKSQIEMRNVAIAKTHSTANRHYPSKQTLIPNFIIDLKKQKTDISWPDGIQRFLI